jgi:hypothetical protein
MSENKIEKREEERREGVVRGDFTQPSSSRSADKLDRSRFGIDWLPGVGTKPEREGNEDAWREWQIAKMEIWESQSDEREKSRTAGKGYTLR